MRVLIAAAGLVAAMCGAAHAQDVQSILLRSVTITCKLDESIAFYRDILNQQVIEDQPQSAVSAARYLQTTPDAKVRFVVMKGSAVYPGGEIIGGRVAFMGIDDPKSEACKNTDAPNPLKGVHGSHIHPHRVANIDEIGRRAKAKNVPILFGPQPSGSRLSRSMMMLDPNGRIVEVFEVNIAKLAE